MDDLLVISDDGSHTVVSSMYGVQYHSRHGAIQETKTVFINAGLQYQLSKGYDHLSILEMGFGTGLNALMTLTYPTFASIKYDTIEAYPISEDNYLRLNYPEILELDDDVKHQFMAMHSVGNKIETSINDRFTFRKYIQKLEDFIPERFYDIIYFDAFAPSSQEELWTSTVMQKMYDACNHGGVLVTYCAKGSFKRALKEVGFEVENIPGPKGKREMTRAIRY